MAVLTQITSRRLADNSVTSAKVQGDVIAAGDLAANSVGASELANDAVDTAAVADDAITYVKMQNLGTANRVLGSTSTGVIGETQVAAAMIATDAVDGTKLVDNAVNSEHYTDGSIDTAHIADGNVTIPKIKEEIIMISPNLLINKQSEFAKTGGIHASALLSDSGDVISSREDVGRHNALDKLIGHTLNNETIEPKKQFIACSGRLNFELVQKGLMSNIGLMAGVGAPPSLAIDLAKRYDMTLLGFVKENSFNIYSNINRVILKN